MIVHRLASFVRRRRQKPAGAGLPAARGRLAAAILLALAAACSASEESAPVPERSPSPSSDALSPSGESSRPGPPEGSRQRRPLVVFLGDSLTAGLGLAEGEAYPALVAAELARRGLPVRVVNAGVSGDTSAGGLARLDWLLRQEPDLVLVELGANDGLRGQPVESIESNLRRIVERSRAAGAEVILAGMKMPPNYGPEYTAEFEALYPRLAEQLGIGFIPFLLEGVAADPELNLPDGLHPNSAGHEVIASTVAEALAPRVRELSPEPPPAPRPAG